MSYDVRVYSRDRVDRDDVIGLVGAASCAVDAEASCFDSLIVVRGARKRYSFTIGLAVPIEVEDVPAEVAVVALGLRYLYEVRVEGSASSELPFAVRLARKLAEASAGVVYDEQEGTLWLRGNLRTPPKVKRGLIDVVELGWWLTNRVEASVVATTWLDAARRHLPEAVPRRWGIDELFSQTANPDHPESFAEYAARTEATVFFKGAAPSINGSVDGAESAARVGHVGLTVHRGALEDPAWREPLQRLFTEFASRMDVAIGTAEVVRNLEWSGRSLWSSLRGERPVYLAPGRTWTGLPPYPVWWMWFGRDYAPLVRSHLDATQIMVLENGIFHARSQRPMDRDQLIVKMDPDVASKEWPEGVLGRPPAAIPTWPWLPSDLLAIPENYDPERRPWPHLRAAKSVPAALQWHDPDRTAQVPTTTRESGRAE